MNLKTYVASWTRWLLQFIQLQLFITLFSLPILIAWGLPLSILSPVGNLIFSPILALFLFLSCLIFFCEIFYFPNGLLITILEILTSWWLAILNIPDKWWLIGFRYPPRIVLLSLPCVALVIMLHPKTRSVYRSTGCFALVLGIFMGVMYYIRPRESYEQIACNNGVVHIIHKAEAVTVVDPGVMGSRASGMSWAQYTLMPHIIQSTGRTTIDHLILLRPGTFLFQTIAQLARCATIKNIYLVYWQGVMSKNGLHAYGGLKRAVDEYRINVVRIGTVDVMIPLSEKSVITVTPLSTSIAHNDITYYACQVQTQIDNNNITFYSAHYNHKENVCLPAQEERN